MNRFLFRSTVLTMLLMATAAFGQQKSKDAAAPVPPAIASARTIFISN